MEMIVLILRNEKALMKIIVSCFFRQAAVMTFSCPARNTSVFTISTPGHCDRDL